MLKTLASLSKSSTRIKASKAKFVHETVQHFINDGAEKIGVITDFDFTLSRYHCLDGSKGLLTHELFLGTGNDKLKDLCQKYAPIECDKSLTVEQKAPHMMQWWKESNDVIISKGYDKKSLEKLVLNSKSLQMRDGFEEFFRISFKSQIPVLIFSAGLADIIEIIFRQNFPELPKNVKIISNWMKFDENDKVIDFRLPIIHTFNKYLESLKENEEHTKILEHFSQKTNLLLLGDTLDDARMNDGLKFGRVLKIGYLNKNAMELRVVDQFAETFDIVCIEDSTLDVPIDILKAVIDDENPD